MTPRSPRRPSGSRPATRGTRKLGERRPPTTQRKAMMTTRRWIALGSILVVLAAMIGPTMKSYLDQRARMHELAASNEVLDKRVAELEREKALWETDSYVEAQARKRLKFVKVGDQAYTVIDPNAKPTEVDPDTGTAVAESQLPWYRQIEDSAKAADDPNHAPGP